MTVVLWYTINVVVNFILFFVETIIHAKKTGRTLRREMLGEVFTVKDLLMYCFFIAFLLLPIIPTIFILGFILDNLQVDKKIGKILDKPLITTK